jgi:hypothetical protein
MPQDESIFYRILSSRQLEVTEDGKLIQKDKAVAYSAKQMLRKQHGRDNRPRQKVTLDELFGDNLGVKK